ncbi:putative Ig domain-containing protein [Dyadobacter sp. CY326]|uniref:putative Ig domain-containing protein n=1 Tax=Dyadobacter sp. CY326 TaxID=2907300 RepID=UPI001F41709F|nr:putative Ig domain-containing protein [Dyadobacter sp. CY326]MCE7064202.1 putative Ig domain-containing protein [Dyadobacter sp. CY326]
MKSFTINVFQAAASKIRPAALLACLISLGVVGLSNDAFAQKYRRVYAISQTNSGAGDINQPQEAVDGNLATSSSLEFPNNLLGGQPNFQALTFPSSPTENAPVATDQVHIKLGIDASLLSLGGSVSIQAYDGGTAVGTPVTITSLLSALGGEAQYDYVFAPGVDFTSVRISTNALLDLGGDLDIYEAYINKDATSEIACNGVADILNGNAGALVGGINGVITPGNAADGNDASRAILTAAVSAAGAKTYVTPIFNSVSPAGDIIRVLVGSPTVLLDASVLSEKIAITTYLGNIATNVFANNPLININLLGGGSFQEILVPASTPFDRIEVSLANGLVQALSSLDVYEIGTAIAPPTVTTSNVTIYSGKTAELAATFNGSGVLWEHPTFPSSTANPYTTPALTQSTSFTVKTTRAGCTNLSAAATANVTVLNLTVEDLPGGILGTPYPFSTPIAVGEAGRDLSYALVAGQGNLPSGLTLDPSTGIISGTPTQSGTFNFKVQITDVTGGGLIDAGTFDYDITIVTNLALKGGFYPAGNIGDPYSKGIPAGLGASGGVGPYIYEAVTPADLPTGMTLSTTGTLSGTPTENGNFTFTVRVTDSEGNFVEDDFEIEIGTLPVTLVSFKATSEGPVALLSWSTATETNSDRFEIERSNNGKKWDRIGSVASNHESAQQRFYDFKDAQPLDGQNFYRLKMVDRDETFAYSHIENVNFAGTAFIYPNPVVNAENINLNLTDWSKVKLVKVVNAQGKTVFEASNALTTGISTRNLSSGTYVVQVLHINGTISAHKFVRF